MHPEREFFLLWVLGLAVARFDRTPDGPVHVEDFAQVFGVYPESKYGQASACNVAAVVGAEGTSADVAEFIRRLTFNTLIGNADLHLKNWTTVPLYGAGSYGS